MTPTPETATPTAAAAPRSPSERWRDKCDTAFTTGAHITPVQYEGEWRWIVSGFEDDTFFDGDTIDTNESAECRADLVNDDEDEVSSYLDFLSGGGGDYINIVPED